jgi:hypothetical protein
MSSIDRRSHCLVGEKTLAMPRHLLFFDTETRPEKLDAYRTKQTLKLGVACYYRKGYGRHLTRTDWIDFTSAGDFWRFVFERAERKQRLWCIARNVVFDFTVLQGWRHLRLAGYKCKFFHNKGTTTIISVKGEKKSIVFVDSMNYFRESLAATGQRIGLPKLTIDFETCSDSYLQTYCHRDVEIELENFKQFIRFLEQNHVSRLCYTIGSTAMAAYLFGHYAKKIYIHNNKEAVDLERDSYRGGRCECFYLGGLTDGPYYILDVNSLYPFVMFNSLYPCKYQKTEHQVSPQDMQEALRNFSAVAEVLIDTDEPAYGVRRERLFFPIGKFWTTLTTPELQYALDRGHLVKTGRVVFYEQTDLFSSYVSRFYKLRQEFRSAGVAAYEELCKLLLNTLYGKFGQKAEDWVKIGDAPDEPDRVELLFMVKGRRVTQIRYLLGEVFELTGHSEAFNSFPAIASHVTAFGRMYLYELMKQAGQGNYFYCDTDSLIVNEVGLWNLANKLDPISLGSLKTESTTSFLHIRGLKDYSIETKQVVKGIRKNAVNISDGVYQQELWPSFRGTLRSGDADTYTVTTVQKVLHRDYLKGYVTPSGMVVPFALAEPSERR